MPNQIPHQNLAYQIIGAAMEVHSQLGPGYNEEIYQKALEIELRNRKIPFEPQRSIVIKFRDEMVGLKIIDYWVDDKVVVEIKALSRLDTDHEAQIISYLKATDGEVGLLINFGEKKLTYKRILPPVKVRDWEKGSSDQIVNGLSG
ncbi:MAG: GxxExxY protein [Candidatus Zixiibacteriota bacterium]